MLNRITAIPTVAVKDLKRARRFYEDVLGLKPSGGDEPGVVTYGNGGCGVLVYESRFAGTNQATSVTWVAGDGVDDEVRTLKGKGDAFEHYEFPDMKIEGDVHVSGSMRAAWFKDPDGNIHALVSR